MSKKSLLLVGAGRWGKVYLRNLHQHHRATIGGIVTSQQRSELAGFDGGARIFLNFSEAIQESWDGVILASPPSVHAEQLRDCLRRSLPTLVEKPLALTEESANSLDELCGKMGIPVLVGHIHLFHPGFEWLKREFSLPGQISGIESVGTGLGPYRKEYSALWDYGPHDLSMILTLAAGDLIGVQCEAKDTGTVDGGQAGSFSACLRFSSGQEGRFFVSNRSEKKRRSLGLTANGQKYTLEDFPVPRLTAGSQEIPLPAVTPLNRMLNVFCDGLDGNLDDRWGLTLGVRVVKALAACERSMALPGAMIRCCI